MVSVTDADVTDCRSTLDALREADRGNGSGNVSSTISANPLILVTVIMEVNVADEPAAISKEYGLASMRKSCSGTAQTARTGITIPGSVIAVMGKRTATRKTIRVASHLVLVFGLVKV